MSYGAPGKSVNNTGSIGVYGGTFDPPHQTHLDIARAAMEHGALSNVLFVVAAIPPHKQNDVFAAPEERLEMVRAAVADTPEFEACDMELRRGGASYTIDTLRELKAAYPGREFVLILGSDSLADLPHWREFKGILELARVLSVPRAGESDVLSPQLTGRYQEIPFAAQNTSSTEIRQLIAAGAGFEDQVPPGVAAYIKEKGLYGYVH